MLSLVKCNLCEVRTITKFTISNVSNFICLNTSALSDLTNHQYIITESIGAKTLYM